VASLPPPQEKLVLKIKTSRTNVFSSHEVSHQVRLLLSNHQNIRTPYHLCPIQQPVGLCGPWVHEETHPVYPNLL